MPKLPSLSLARLICRAFRDDDFILVIIYGPLRMGKSAYAMKVMGQVYEYFFGKSLSVDLVRDYMGFHPSEVVDRWLELGDKRIPMYVWDDAGYWLYSLDWNDPLLKAVQKYMNVVGTDMNCLMLTTPDPTWILSKILNMPGTVRGRIIKRDGGIRDQPSSLYARRCRGYKPYRMPDLKKTGVNVLWEDDFSCRIPDDVWGYYYPLRRGYALRAKQNIVDMLKPKKKDEDKSMDELVKGLKYLTNK